MNTLNYAPAHTAERRPDHPPAFYRGEIVLNLNTLEFGTVQTDPSPLTERRCVPVLVNPPLGSQRVRHSQSMPAADLLSLGFDWAAAWTQLADLREGGLPLTDPRIGTSEAAPTHVLRVKHTTSLQAHRRVEGSFAKCLTEARGLNLPTVDYWRIQRLSDGVIIAEWHADTLAAAFWKTHRTQELFEQWQEEQTREVIAALERSITGQQ
jgi:hypothetical protein